MKTLFFAVMMFFSNFVIASQVSFNDYSVNGNFEGKNHVLIEPSSGNDIVDSMRIKISKLPPNFAGHYTIYTFGCGGGARCGEIYDASTGRVVVGLPNAYLDDDNFDLSFKKNSTLLIISGVAADPDNNKDDNQIKSSNRERYYNFANNKLMFILGD